MHIHICTYVCVRIHIMYGSRAASVNMCRGRYRDEEEARFVFYSMVGMVFLYTHAALTEIFERYV